MAVALSGAGRIFGPRPIRRLAGQLYLPDQRRPGRIGSLVAADIARRAPAMNLILVGSSPLDPARQAILDSLGQLGAKVYYRQKWISAMAPPWPLWSTIA